MAKYVDDTYETIKSDIERLRKKTTMYISNKGTKGALHLCKEAINNAIDECMSEKSPANKIDITLDSNTNQLMVIDNGRGIPFTQVETICTFLHSGSNIDKETEKEDAAEFAGENGVGTTAINALSKKLYFTIRRDGKIGTFTFVDGKMQEPVYTKGKANDHGTAIVFIPDEKYLGKCTISPKELESWINNISYTVPSSIKITYNHIKKGKDLPVTKVYHHPKGMEDLIDEMVPTTMIKPIHIYTSSDEFEDKKTHCETVITIADGDISDAKNVKSFCNRVITIDGGSHVDAVKNAWCKAVIHMTNEAMTDSEKSKYSVTYEDCRAGLSFIVVVNTPVPGFTGQTKQKVDNNNLYREMTVALQRDLKEYFEANPTEAKKVITLVKAIARERNSAIKVRRSDYKPYDKFEAITSKVYSPCSSKGYKELWIMEGDSAKGSFTNYRDYRFQAGFKLRGNPKNVYGCSVGEILQNPELRALTKVLGCGIGKDFNLKKLQFDKIIFFVDSDIDGWNMVSLLSAYFLCLLPEVVKAGHVYRAMAPFYLLNDKKHPYIVSKNEYFDLFAERVSKIMHLVDAKGKKLGQPEMRKLIMDNKDYLDELESLVKYYATNYKIIEFAILYGDDKNFGKLLTEKFPELTYDPVEKNISGSYNASYQYLNIGKQFKERSSRLARIINEADHGEVYYGLVENGKTTAENVSLGEFFIRTKAYLPSINKRIKGIGELPGKVLWETTLNPEHRELTRLTVSDMEDELETVRILHGPETSLRKSFMSDYVFNSDDLDT